MIELAEMREFEAAAARLARAFEPDAVPSPDVVPMWEAVTRAQRAINAITTLLARRVEDTREWERAGHRNAAEFVAQRSGSSVGAARAQLDVSKKLEQLPAVADAVRSGELSESQAGLVADGATANPDAQGRLVALAKRSSLPELRDAVLRTRAATDPDPDVTEKRIHAARQLRTWRDAEGGWNLAARGRVGDGARIEAALKPLIDSAYATARAEQRHEPRDAYAFDALVGLTQRSDHREPATRPTARTMTIVRVDLDALTRGRVHDDETCDIRGIGPIPVSTARQLLGESILKLVITKGNDVLNVTHLGRGPNTAQQIALLWSAPMCTVEGCCRTRVEHDHREPFAKTRHTRLDELDPLCEHHHDQKTVKGWALTEGTSKRAIVPPADPRHPKNRPREPAG